MILISEISNCHFGSIAVAKELIRSAKDSGADLVKAQAFQAKDVKTGSMPPWFYDSCQLSVAQYVELIHYARDTVGIELFYSIFSDGMEDVRAAQRYEKVTAAQAASGAAIPDRDNVFASIPYGTRIPKVDSAHLLHVSAYLATDPELSRIQRMSRVIDRTVGYSDHTIGIQACVEAVRTFGADVVEKHFCLKNDVRFGSITYRDTVFGSTPSEFARLAKEIK